MAYRRPKVVAATLAVAVLVLDQLTKFWAVSVLTGHEPVPLLGDLLQLRLLYNSGAAFSLGSGSTWVFTTFTAAAVLILGWSVTRIRSAGRAIAVGLLLGGASTHLLDRLLRDPGFGVGHVVDFIDYNGWFVGNLADIAITVGVALLLAQSFLVPRGSGTG